MIRTASLSVLSLLASIGLAVAGWGSPIAVAHIAFAIGIVPLIFAAMIHFVPVLTRTGDPRPLVASVPGVAQLAGGMVVLAMQGGVSYNALYGAAAVDLLLAAFLLNWIAARARSALGSPHPGWRWYGVALGCLMLALLAILLMPLWPAFWPNLRLFHLHLNTIGLVGLAAFGTLPVLMPTVIGVADPEAAGWLRRRLWLMAGGAVVLATGAAVSWALAAPGAALVLVAVLGLVGHWGRRFGVRRMLADGASASLLSASCGLLVVLGAGVVHGAGLVGAQPTLFGWAAGFLLPLVTGALTHLLPVWRFPGPQLPIRGEMRRRLAATGRWRAALFLVAGVAFASGFPALGAVLTGAAMLLFVAGFVLAMSVSLSTR